MIHKLNRVITKYSNLIEPDSRIGLGQIFMGVLLVAALLFVSLLVFSAQRTTSIDSRGAEFILQGGRRDVLDEEVETLDVGERKEESNLMNMELSSQNNRSILGNHNAKQFTVDQPVVSLSEFNVIDDAASSDLAIPPVDLVYTWVNSSDPDWLDQISYYSSSWKPNKFRDWDELRYSMRSVHKFMPWIRNIILVVANRKTQVPIWLQIDHPQIRIVTHDQIFEFPDLELPTFSSLAIESYLHRIPNISDMYLYMNNDLLLGTDVYLTDFVTKTEYIRYFDFPLHNSFPCAGFLGEQFSNNLRVQKKWNELKGRKVIAEKCMKDIIFANAKLSFDNFQVRPPCWFMHMPHLFYKPAVEQTIMIVNDALKLTRVARFRESGTQVNIFMQYESFLESRQNKPDRWKLIRPVFYKKLSKQNRDNLYLFKVFQDHDSFPGYYESLRANFNSNRPKFFAIDDDLSAKPSEKILEFHRSHLIAFYQSFFPDPAPWEISTNP